MDIVGITIGILVTIAIIVLFEKILPATFLHIRKILMRNVSIRRGFPHLHQVNRSLYLLHKHLSPDLLEEYQRKNLKLRVPNQLSSPVIEVQELAKMLAQYYNLSVGTIVVTFKSDLSTSGKIELSVSNNFFIELHQKHAKRGKDIMAILAHEITHIFLHKRGISFANTIDDEILTDTVAAYLGLGHYIMDAFLEETAPLDANRRRIAIQHFGYLTPDEFGYVLAKREKMFHENPYRPAISSLVRSALDSGRKQMEREWMRPPLFGPKPESWHTNLLAHQARKAYTHARTVAKETLSRDRDSNQGSYQHENYTFDWGRQFSVVFSCPQCSQKLRIPVVDSEIKVQCSLCQMVFRCQS